MLASLGAMAMIAVLATAPASGSAAPAPERVTLGTASLGSATASQPRPAIPWVERYRAEIRRTRPSQDLKRRLAVGVGAALAWNAADLPRHRAPGILPRGDFRPGALFAAPLFAGPETADQPGGAIASLIARWNRQYPPYALEMDERPLSGEAAAGTIQPRSGPCPAN